MSVGTPLKTPVALILFDRQHTARQVFAAIRKVPFQRQPQSVFGVSEKSPVQTSLLMLMK
jgi:hypothetical protein